MKFTPTPSNLHRRTLLSAAAAFSLPAMTSMAQASAWPNKAINLLVPFPPGGPTDVQMRALAIAMSKSLGQQVVVVNQPGAGGTLAPTSMARTAASDGYTLAMITPSVFRVPHLQKVGYDVLKDFTYIASLSRYVQGMSVPVNSPFMSLADVVAFAKANPGKLSMAAVGHGTLGHITTHRLQKLAGIEVNYVPFKGGSDALAALMGGHVDVMMEAGWGTMVAAGKTRLLAVPEDKRLPSQPQVPTFKELGYDIVVRSTTGIAGPKNLPAAVVAKVEAALKQATQDVAYKKALEVESMPNLFEDSKAYTQYAFNQYESDKRSVRELGLSME